MSSIWLTLDVVAHIEHIRGPQIRGLLVPAMDLVDNYASLLTQGHRNRRLIGDGRASKAGVI